MTNQPSKLEPTNCDKNSRFSEPIKEPMDLGLAVSLLLYLGFGLGLNTASFIIILERVLSP